ncbi:MAG: phosphohydrolase [Ilumatobacter sp.]
MSDTELRTSFTTFEESTKDDWMVIADQLNATQAMAAENIVTQLRMLERDHGGFPVSRLEHSLQTATRADSRDDEYVLCALIHDIGDTLAPFNHPSIAAGIVKPFVSEANHWMVEHHGIFQGYYFWHHLGMDRNARDAFIDSPYYAYTEEFCAKYDQTAFDADYVSAPLSHFEPLIEQFFKPTTRPATRGQTPRRDDEEIAGATALPRGI